MANEIVITAAQIGAVYPQRAEIYDFIAAETITKGQAVCFNATYGTVEVADANLAGNQQFRGIALEGGGTAQVIPVLVRGHCYGFTLSGMSYDDIAYLSDTVGALSTAVGTMTVNCGRVVALPDKDKTKVLFIDADYLRAWA